jgi:hypothetical protein
MDDEIEYLSEEMLASIDSPILNLYYVYFDDAGRIDSITNEKRLNSLLNFIEVEYKRVEKLLLGTENFINYVVSLADKDTPVLVKKTEDAGANTNLLISIDQLSSKNTTLNVKWDASIKSWKFYVNPEYKNQFRDLGLSSQLLFFITVKNNSNFLVNSFSIDMKELIKSDSITFPWKSVIEENLDNVSISTKRFFDSYGIETNE